MFLIEQPIILESSYLTQGNEMEGDKRDLRVIAKELKDGGMRCNCDLDNWEPERNTGHSHVCRIHKLAMAMKYRPYDINKGGQSS